MAFLDELISCQSPACVPWLCLGEFNMIYEACNKNNNNLNRRLMGRFRRPLDANELLELKLQNRRFTWSNGRASPTLVHLERVFCNKDWDTIFPIVSLQALTSSLSDHSPFSSAVTSKHRDWLASVLNNSGLECRVPTKRNFPHDGSTQPIIWYNSLASILDGK